MPSGFWSTLPRPFFCLAPMSNITDAAERRMLARHGKPDVMFTEFVSVAGLCSRGRERLLIDMLYDGVERPVVVQFFGREPKQFREASRLARDLGFDGVDINLGCPDKGILRQGAGSNLINFPDLTGEIIAAAKEGAGPLPVSVKTRTGYFEESVDTWIPQLISFNPAAISLHGRTRRMRYRGKADWPAIERAAALCRAAGVPLVGNGDVFSRRQGEKLAARHHVDGVMIGRAILGNPWIFRRDMEKKDLPVADILAAMVEHAALYEELFTGVRGFENMRKHFVHYVTEFPGARYFRARLMQAHDTAELAALVDEFLAWRAEHGDEPWTREEAHAGHPHPVADPATAGE